MQNFPRIYVTLIKKKKNRDSGYSVAVSHKETPDFKAPLSVLNLCPWSTSGEQGEMNNPGSMILLEHFISKPVM